MAKLLSTKVLSPKNHKKISDARIKISDYNAIKIEKIDFNVCLLYTSPSPRD